MTPPGLPRSTTSTRRPLTTFDVVLVGLVVVVAIAIAFGAIAQ